MSPALKAHFRLLRILPVRTHRKLDRAPTVPKPGSVTPALEERIRELASQGRKVKEIERELHVSYNTVRKVVGPQRAPRKKA